MNIDYGDLMSLQQSYFSDKRRLSEVLQLWIDGRPTEVKWSVIITAVELPPVDDLSLLKTYVIFSRLKMNKVTLSLLVMKLLYCYSFDLSLFLLNAKF